MRVLVALALLGAGCSSPSTPSPERGRLRYGAYCAGCHQPDGRGLEGGGPPLSGSPWVSGPDSRLIRIVLHGVRGAITVGDVTVDREMLGFGPILSNEEIAALLTFVRAEFGGRGAITPEAVRRVRDGTRERTDYWTVSELLAIP